MSMMTDFILKTTDDGILFEITKQDFDVVLKNNNAKSEYADKYKNLDVIKPYKIHPLQKIFVIEDRLAHNGQHRFVFIFRYRKQYFVFMQGPEQ